jgi:hypothetical protein
MSDLICDVLHEAQKRGIVPRLDSCMSLPLPAINKVELYLSFYGNDRCAHCITCSGPERKELMHPDTASLIIKNISRYSILAALRKIMGGGEYYFKRPQKCIDFDNSLKPPARLTDSLITAYADCIMGKGFTSEWIKEPEAYRLNFGRPSIRLSGGEFYTWPHKLNGKVLKEDERLSFQEKLLEDIRENLPEYDIWILTNGRFAESMKKTHKILKKWAGKTGSNNKRGKTRICISVDVFHRPPKNSTVKKMLYRIWAAAKNNGLSSPYIYSITSKRIFLLGRALENFESGVIPEGTIKNVSHSLIKNSGYLTADPVNLLETDGCNELKGFSLKTPKGIILANNIVINYSGHLAYCCVCVGDYGDFLFSPEDALRQLIRDPVSLMLRNGDTAVEFLNMAVDLDSSIKTFGNSKYEKATGSTCYQLLSGKRV